MKNNDANNKPWLILLIAIVFVLGGGAAILFTPWLEMGSIIGLILCPVGILLFVFGLLRAIQISKVRNLMYDASAIETTANFVKSKVSSYTSTSINGVPTSMNVYRKIIYTYIDENGVSHTVKSTLSYFGNQVDYLKNLGAFRIKCKGKVSVIIEPLPDTNSNYNL